MSLAHKVLATPPSYRGFLEATRWEDETDLLIRDFKQRNAPRLMPEIVKAQKAHELGAFHMFGSLHVRMFRPIKDFHPEEVRKLSQELATTFDGVWTSECQKAMSEIAEVFNFGLASMRVITTAGVNFLTDAWQGTASLTQMRYHGIGSGTNAEATSDTALQTEFTTQLTPASTRATGTQTEGAGANIFRTVGSNVVNSSVTAAEHGIFSQQATGGGTLWDRSQFTGVGLVNGNTFQTTYDLTLAAGG